MFYSSYIVGFEELVPLIIRDKHKDVEIIDIFNGAVIYKTSSLKNIINMPFLNNNFFVHKYAKETNINSFINQLSRISLKKANYKSGFRIVISDQNNLISIDNKLLSKLENKIASETGNYVKRNNPNIEYWILKRSEGFILFMERINKHKSFDKQLKKGELRSDLCYFLNYLSNPEATDIYLDCFCGSGALIKNRIKINKFNMIFGVDIKQSNIKQLRLEYKQNNIIFKNIDFFVNKFEDGFIDKIVTDPPWGIYENVKDIDAFYQKLIYESERILKDNGRLIVLTACKETMKNIKTELILINTYNILVSGKKARVYFFQKKKK